MGRTLLIRSPRARQTQPAEPTTVKRPEIPEAWPKHNAVRATSLSKIAPDAAVGNATGPAQLLRAGNISVIKAMGFQAHSAANVSIAQTSLLRQHWPRAGDEMQVTSR